MEHHYHHSLNHQSISNLTLFSNKKESRLFFNKLLLRLLFMGPLFCWLMRKEKDLFFVINEAKAGQCQIRVKLKDKMGEKKRIEFSIDSFLYVAWYYLSCGDSVLIIIGEGKENMLFIFNTTFYLLRWKKKQNVEWSRKWMKIERVVRESKKWIKISLKENAEALGFVD